MLKPLIAIPVTELQFGTITVTADIDVPFGMDIEERRGMGTNIRDIRLVTDLITSRTIGLSITGIELNTAIKRNCPGSSESGQLFLFLSSP
ncbi:MAG: hypothetical protein ACIAZJ_19210 [Gimesia chilikensis]|uniref:hypothetical protein n=1 Tax=Gimesia chilikensis TaxID=2605989 RepID=UPI00378999A8